MGSKLDGFDASPLGAFTETPLGARDEPATTPFAGESRDFLEFISTDNSGSFEGTLRVHGDEEANMDEIDQITAFLTDRSTIKFTGSTATFSYDASTSNTVLNGTKAVSTPFGVTDIVFTSGGSAVTGAPQALRIRAKNSLSAQREHWTDLVEGLSSGSSRYYDTATRILWGEMKLISSQLIGAGSTSLCSGGTYTHVAGVFEHFWRVTNAGGVWPATADLPFLLESWGTPSEQWDWTGHASCGADPTLHLGPPPKRHYSDGSSLANWDVFVPGGSALTTISGEWICYAGDYTWPAFQ